MGSMSSTNINAFFVCYVLLAIVSSLARDQPVCQYSKQKKLFTADCSNKALQDVPNNLNSDIEVLDLSLNRIRELTNNSFTCCTSIKLLYLQSNSIYEIDSHAFYPLTSLKVLDLNFNVLSQVPQNIPSTVYRLYLDGNPKIFENDDNWSEKISSLSSLEVLTISSNKLQKFPTFRITPNLIELNISYNRFSALTAEDLAPLCMLKYLQISSEMFAQREQFCDCLKFERWTSKYEINVQSFACKKDKTMTEQCNVEPQNTTVVVREKCLAEFNARNLPFKLMIGSGAVALILCLCILLYIRHRRRKREKSQTTGGQNSRTPSVKFDNKTLEENNERAPVEEDKLLKQ